MLVDVLRNNRSAPWLATFGVATAVTAVAAIGILLPNPLYLIVGLLALGVVGLSVRYPVWGVFALVFVSFTRFSDVMVQFHGTPSLAQPLVLFLLCVVFGRALLLGDVPQGWRRPTFMVGVVVVVSGITLMWAFDIEAGKEGFEDVVKDTVVALTILLMMQRPAALMFATWSLILGGLFLGSLSVYQYLSGSFDSEFGGFAQADLMHLADKANTFRISGPIGDPNFFAQIMLVAVPLAASQFFLGRNMMVRVVAGLAATVSILAVIFTFSRGALIGMLVMAAFAMKRRPPTKPMIFSAVLVGLIALPFIPEEYAARLWSIPEAIMGLGSTQPTGPSEVSIRGRLSELLVAVLMFLDHPLLGVGLDNYPALYQDYAQQVGLESRHTQRNAHNLYIEIAAELGSVGLLVFLSLIWSMFKGVSEAARTFLQRGQVILAEQAYAFRLSLLAYFTAALFLHTAYPRYFWMLYGISMGISNIVIREKHGDEQAEHA